MNFDLTRRHGALPDGLDVPARNSAGRAPAQPTAVSSSALLQGHNVVHIEHNGALYQLRSTRLGKLILTK